MSDLTDHRIVPLAAPAYAAEADAVADGLVTGGLPVVEVALRTPYAATALRDLASRGDLLVGAGTVLDAEQARRSLDDGAAFLVSPGLLPEVVEVALGAGVPVLPGIATPSEVMSARALGLRQVKVFPAGLLGGPAWLDALASVFADVRFMPSGGVSPDTLADYLDHPAVFAVSGSWIAGSATASRGADAVAAAAATAREAAS